MRRDGWVKLSRCVLDDPLLNKDPEHLALWVHLLVNAAFEPTPALLGGKRVMLQPGQLTTGRKQLSLNSGIKESKVERVLNAFESAQLIGQQSTNKNRLITILSWSNQCDDGQQSGQQSDNERTTSEQPADTLEEIKNLRTQEERIFEAGKPKKPKFTPPTLEQVAEYVKERGSKVIPQDFIDYYESNGWMVGKAPMKDWKAACRRAEKWERWDRKTTGGGGSDAKFSTERGTGTSVGKDWKPKSALDD